MEFPQVALRGRAVDVDMYAPDGKTIERIGVVFTANVLADLEARFAEPLQVPVTGTQGGVVLDDEGKTQYTMVMGLLRWQDGMERFPFSTMRATFAIVLGVDERSAGDRMIDDRLPDYMVAMSAALGIANGLDPTLALERGKKETGLAILTQTKIAETMVKAANAVDDLQSDENNDDESDELEAKERSIPGSNGSPRGLVSVESPRPSGD